MPYAKFPDGKTPPISHNELQAANSLPLVADRFDRDPQLCIYRHKQRLAPFMDRLKDQARSRMTSGKFIFKDCGHFLTPEELSVFRWDEILRIEHGAFIMFDSESEEFLRQLPLHGLVWKVGNSQWRYGFDKSWNATVRTLQGMARFDMGVPGVEMVADHATSANEKGGTQHLREYLDGALGLIAYWKGRPALKIGFSVAEDNRILLQQVQGIGRGNRWFYKLPCRPWEYVVGKMHEAFEGMELCVPVGPDQAVNIARAYIEEEKVEQWMGDHFDAVSRMVSAPFKDFARREIVRSYFGVRFRRLERKA